MLLSAAAPILLVLSTCLGLASSIPHRSRNIKSAPSELGQSVDLKVHRTKRTSVSSASRSFRGARQASTAALDDDGITISQPKDLFSIPVTVGSQSFDLLIDIGSADTWVADAFFSCFHHGSIFPQSFCALGGTLNQTSDPTITSITDVNLFARFGLGDFAAGPMARALLSFTSDTTFMQEVGIVSMMEWSNGDNFTSGVLGLAPRNSTSKFPGTDWTNDLHCPLNSSTTIYGYDGEYTCNQMNYDSVSVNLASRLSRPYITLALSRDSSNSSNGGSITFGGLGDTTDARINSTGRFTDVPIEPLASDDTKSIRSYIISVEGVSLPVFTNLSTPTTTSSTRRSTPTDWDHIRKSHHHVPQKRSAGTTFIPMASSPNSTTTNSAGSSQFFLESNLPFLFFPLTLAKSYNNLFTPTPDHYYDISRNHYIYELNCTELSYVPPLAITIAGDSFPINPEDLVIREQVEYYDYESEEYIEEELCYSAVTDSAVMADEVSLYNALGQPFLKNVLMLIDLEDNTVALSSRPYYES
ncbi:hypothetical protein LTR05_002531 [Lithohypha guttulata]|uniref:Peptidase A1 domain-containing protein n=1 Tax=Lithohypha guttulata TaxID=1690604 RepID=A0AAN7T3G8_9EURO|nr:hypothetical protein LTR05_002531 [Lithohypha guttulata]